MTILGIALVILGYGYFSRWLALHNISGPMIFTAVGILLSPLFLGQTPVKPDAEAVQIVAEIALILIREALIGRQEISTGFLSQ